MVEHMAHAVIWPLGGRDTSSVPAADAELGIMTSDEQSR